MAKFYAVKGEENLIFTEWDECKAFLEGKKGYKYKSFSTKEEAEAFLSDRDYYAEVLEKDLKEGYAVAFTDGSFEENAQKYSYGVVAIGLDGKENYFCDFGSDERFMPSRNIAGETQGVLTALKWAFVNGYTRLRIYHDYAGLSEWATGRWSYSSPVAESYVKAFKRYSGVVAVDFVKVKGHSNHKYNEMVDKLAKESLFDGKRLPVEKDGFQMVGTHFAQELLTYLNQKAPKAKISCDEEKYNLKIGDDELDIYESNGYTAVVGKVGFLYNLSIAYFIENYKKIGVNRLIERVFGYETPTVLELTLKEIAIISKDKCGKNKAPSIIFLLNEIERLIKEKLQTKDKISSKFIKDGDVFVLKEDYIDSQKIERAYNLFYNLRVNYFSLNLGEKDVLDIINSLESVILDLG